MKRLKYLFMAVSAMAAFAACSEDCDIAAGSGTEGIYFPGTSKIELAMDATSAEIPLSRMSAGGAETVNFIVDAPEIFNVPTSASFADGSKDTSFTITFNNEDIELAEEYEITIELADLTKGTPYGASTYTFIMTIPPPYTDVGNGKKGSYYDYMFDDYSYPVVVEQNDLDPTTFRVTGYYEDFGPDAMPVEFRILQVGETLNGVTIDRDDLVYYSRINTGYFHSTYGDFIYIYHPSAFSNAAGEPAFPDWTYNRVLSWQDNGLPAVVQLAPYYYIPAAGGGWNYTSTNNTITIVFPGVVVADYSIEVTYSGYMTDPKDNRKAVASVKLGKDIQSARVAMLATDDPNEVLEGIEEGTIEYQTIFASGNVEFPLEEDGTYTIVGVTYAKNEDGVVESQEAAYTTFKYVSGSDTRTPIEKEYTLEDLYGFEKADICKTWNMYAIDLYGDSGEREFFGQLEFSEGEPIYNEEYDYDMDIVNVSGLTLGYIQDDTTPWEYDDGILYNLGRSEAFGMINTNSGPMYFGALVYEANEDGIYFDMDWVMVAGFVEDGYMAIVSTEEDYNFCGYDFAAFKAAEMGSTTYVGSFGIGYYDIILQDPAAATSNYAVTRTAVSANTTRTQLHTLVKDMKVASGNMVELRGRERMHALINELRANKKAAAEPTIEVIAAQKLGAANRQAHIETAPAIMMKLK